MTSPLFTKSPLTRWPLRPRPVADPGQVLVFQKSSGELIAPRNGYTTGERWWKGPRAVYVVDVSPHPDSFRVRLPCAGDAMDFDATVTYKWSVATAVEVVRNPITDPAKDCRDHVIPQMRTLARQFQSGDSERAERRINDELGGRDIMLANGLRVSGVDVQMSRDETSRALSKDIEIADLQRQLAEANATAHAAVEAINQQTGLEREKLRAKFYEDVLKGDQSAVVSGIIADDDGKIAKALTFMRALEQQDQELALKAMSVILGSDQIHIGEVDPAVSAAVRNFTQLMSGMSGKLAAGPIGLAAPDPAIEAGPGASDPAAPAIDTTPAEPGTTATADTTEPGQA